jgi:hypothetical protein
LAVRWLLVSLAVFAGYCKSQDSEAGITILNNTNRVLEVNANRPLDAGASLLAKDYAIHINAEDPPFACPDDVVDMRPSQKNPLAADHFYLPKGGRLAVSFSVNKDRRPLNPLSLLNHIVDECNANLSFRYRLQEDRGDVYSFAPIEARDKNCRLVKITALLDHRISLEQKTRGIYETIRVFDSELSKVAGEKTTTNTQSWMNRIPNEAVLIGAQDQPAREVLLAIIRATHYRFHWVAREQPYHGGWTINLIPLTGNR